MYTLLLKDDHSLVARQKCTIMQRSKLTDSIQILTPKFYNGLDYTSAIVKLEYITPVSNTYNFKILTLKNKTYKDNWLQYIIPGDTDITMEAGELEFHLSFLMMAQVDAKEILQVVRETQPFKIYITPTTAWSLQIPDDALEPLNQTILAALASAKQTETYAKELYDNQAKDLAIDEITNRIKILARSGAIGEGLDIDVLAKKIAEIILAPDLDATQDGITYLDEIPQATQSKNITNLDDLLK